MIWWYANKKHYFIPQIRWFDHIHHSFNPPSTLIAVHIRLLIACNYPIHCKLLQMWPQLTTLEQSYILENLPYLYLLAVSGSDVANGPACLLSDWLLRRGQKMVQARQCGTIQYHLGLQVITGNNITHCSKRSRHNVLLLSHQQLHKSTADAGINNDLLNNISDYLTKHISIYYLYLFIYGVSQFFK